MWCGGGCSTHVLGQWRAMWASPHATCAPVGGLPRLLPTLSGVVHFGSQCRRHISLRGADKQLWACQAGSVQCGSVRRLHAMHLACGRGWLQGVRDGTVIWHFLPPLHGLRDGAVMCHCHHCMVSEKALSCATAPNAGLEPKWNPNGRGCMSCCVLCHSCPYFVSQQQHRHTKHPHPHQCKQLWLDASCQLRRQRQQQRLQLPPARTVG